MFASKRENLNLNDVQQYERPPWTSWLEQTEFSELCRDGSLGRD